MEYTEISKNLPHLGFLNDCYTFLGIDFQYSKFCWYSFSPRPGRLWGPPSLISKGYRSSHHVKLITYLHLAPRLRMHGDTPQIPPYVFMVWCLINQKIHLHGAVLS